MKNKTPLKIVLVMEAWGQGGTETYVSGLVRMLNKHNSIITLVLLKSTDCEIRNDLILNNIYVTSLFSLAKILYQAKPDVVNLHLYANLLPAVFISRLTGCKVVTTLHMPPNAWGLRHRLYWHVAMRISNKVVGVSHMILEQLKNNNVYKSPISGGVERAFFSCDREIINDKGKYNICAMGRMVVEKDWQTLIKAVALLTEEMRNRVIINFYGSGPLLSDLRLIAEQKGVQAIFHGYVDKSVLVKELARANLSVLPSRFEGLGLSALEGMAAGVPTITADFSASKDFIKHGVTGHTFPVENYNELSSQIKWHMENTEASHKIGQEGCSFVHKNFSEDITYLPYLDLFQDIQG